MEIGVVKMTANDRENTIDPFRSAINNGSIRLKDFINAADKMGFEVIVKKKQ